MTTFTIVTEEPEVTQATDKIFIHGLPVMYKMLDLEPVEAIYDYAYSGLRNSHLIRLVADGKEVVARTDELTPSRSLTDAEMILYLTEQLYEASNSADSYQQAYRSSDDDIDRIANALSEEAESRGWCEEYSEFCDQVNAVLVTGTRLQPVEREFEIDVEIEATITVTRTVTVTARSQEDAETFVQEDPESFLDVESEISDAASMGLTDYTINVI